MKKAVEPAETCCNANKYSLTVKGELTASENAADMHFMIHPMSKERRETENGVVTVYHPMPFGSVTDALTDKQETAKVKLVAAKLTLQVKNAKAFADNPGSVKVVQDSIAEATEGVTADMISVDRICAGSCSASTRRLAVRKLND